MSEPKPIPALLVHPRPGKDDKELVAMPRGELVMLVGAGGLGKSMATMQLALALTTRKSWLGFHPPKDDATARGAVVMLCAEDGDNIMHTRFKACALKMGITADAALMSAAEALIVPMPGDEWVPRLVKSSYDATGEVVDDGADMAPLTAQLHAVGDRTVGGLALIIIDPIVKFMPAEGEEKNAVASRFIDALKKWTRDLPGKPTVLLIHHTTKSARADGGHTAESARGASSLTDSVRCQFNLFDMGRRAAPLEGEPLGQEALYLACSKSNYGPTGVAVPLVRDPDTGALGVADRNHEVATKTARPASSKGRGAHPERRTGEVDDAPSLQQLRGK